MQSSFHCLLVGKKNMHILKSSNPHFNNCSENLINVCSILWSPHYKELISVHGFSQNQLVIWKYPTMAKVAELKGHTSQVLSLTMSPDGATVASAAADETLRLWCCFELDPAWQREQEKANAAKSSLIHQGIC
ncbi:Cell division cycle protein 20-like protein [Plecturocebus cupreus]